MQQLFLIKQKSLSESFGWSDQYAKDIPYLLAALQEAEDKLADQEDQLNYRGLLEKSLETQRNHTERLNDKLQQSQDRERALREALENILNASSKTQGAISGYDINRIHNYAREALGQEVSPNGS